VVFPPMLIDAEANGRRFQEMHVDGGVTAPVLTLPEAFLLRNGALGRGLRRTYTYLVNDKVERDFQLFPTARSTSPPHIRFCHEDTNPVGALRDL